MTHDFELCVPTLCAFQLTIDEKRVSEILASVAMVDRGTDCPENAGAVCGPMILYAPSDTFQSPQKTFHVRAKADTAKNQGVIEILHASPDTRRIQITQSTEKSVFVENGVSYTRIQGTKEPLKSKWVTDDTIFVNREGVFVVNVKHILGRNGTSLESNVAKTGVYETSQNPSNQNLIIARGYTLINTAM